MLEAAQLKSLIAGLRQPLDAKLREIVDELFSVTWLDDDQRMQYVRDACSFERAIVQI